MFKEIVKGVHREKDYLRISYKDIASKVSV